MRALQDTTSIGFVILTVICVSVIFVAFPSRQDHGALSDRLSLDRAYRCCDRAWHHSDLGGFPIEEGGRPLGRDWKSVCPPGRMACVGHPSRSSSGPPPVPGLLCFSAHIASILL